ncbi:MAG: glycoside hydrolase family 44 protein, partial [Chloroflexota bacterium]
MRFYHPERLFRLSKRKLICAASCVMLFSLFMIRRSLPFTILQTHAGQDNAIIFDDELNDAFWTDLSYGVEFEPQEDLVADGTHALKITHTEGFSSFFMQSPYLIPADSVEHLSFKIHGGDVGDQRINVRIVDGNGEWLSGNVFFVQSGEWMLMEIPMWKFPGLTDIAAVIIQNTTNSPLESYYVDDLELVFKENADDAGDDNVYDLSVDGWHVNHEISPYIYGVNLVDERMGDELNVTVGRYGGNSTSRYNWQISATNLGHDWYFMNVPRDDDPGTLPHGSQTDKFVEQNIGTQTDTIMTVPMMGWVA